VKRQNGKAAVAELDAERALLGAIVMGAPLAGIRPFLRPNDFWVGVHGIVYAQALQLEAAGVPIDNVALASALERVPADAGEGSMLERVGGRAQLQVWVAECPTPRNALYYAEQISRAAAERAGRPAPSHTAPAPIVQRAGLGYRASLPIGVVLAVDRLRESHGDLTGELSVSWTTTTLGNGDGHIYRGRFNLGSLTARSSTARFLGERTQGAQVPWSEVLEHFCVAVMDLHRTGVKTVMVGQLPARQVMPSLFDGGFLLEGTEAELYGPGGAGKTTFAAALIVSMETGQEIIPGLRPVLTGPCFIADYEGDQGVWNDLIAKVAAGAGVAAPAVRYHRCVRPLPELVEELAPEVQDAGIALIVLDSVERASGASHGGETFNDRVGRLQAAVDAIRGAAGTTSLLIDHVAGEDLRSAGAVAKPIGGVMKSNWARETYYMRREHEPTNDRAELVVVDTKRNYRAKLHDLKLAIVYEPGKIRFERIDQVSAPDLAPLVTTGADRIAQLLSAGAMTAPAIAVSLGMTQEAVRAHLSRHRGKRFIKLQDGTWGLASHG